MDKLKLNLEKPIPFFPQLAKTLGGIPEALYFQQLYYWSDKGKKSDGWIYKSKEEIKEETTLSRYQQDRIRKSFEKKDILETKIEKVNNAPTLHYRLKIGIVRNLLNGKNEDLEKQETNDSKSKKLTNPSTEITTENTNLPKGKLETKVSGLNDLIDLFKSVNPSYERLFANKTQRAALERLVKKFGEQKIAKLIKILPETNKRKYAPTITTPYDLEKKLGKLKAFMQKENSNNNKVASFKTK